MNPTAIVGGMNSGTAFQPSRLNAGLPPALDVPPQAAPPADSAQLSGNTTPSGIQFSVTQEVVDSQQAVALEATLPAGVLVAAPVVVKTWRHAQTNQLLKAEAQTQGCETQENVLIHEDQLYIQQPEGRYLALVDDARAEDFLTYSKTDAVRSAPGGSSVPMAEQVHADGSRTVIVNKMVGPNREAYTQISITPQGQAKAVHVDKAPHGQPSEGQEFTMKDYLTLDGWKRGLSQSMSLKGNPDYQETALKADLQATGQVLLSSKADNADLRQAALRSGKHPDYATLDLAKNYLGGAEQQLITPFSAQLAGIAPTPGSPSPIPQAPAKQPGWAEKLGLGGIFG